VITSLRSSMAYNFVKRLKRYMVFEAICKAWTDNPEQFRYDPIHLTSGLNTQEAVPSFCAVVSSVPVCGQGPVSYFRGFL
jgi:hypothetical protein